jgi:hypothetical protein
MGKFAHRCLSNSLFTGLLFAALAVRALIPVGFMPVASNGGALTLQLCAQRGSEVPSVRVGKDGQRIPTSPSHETPCLYSVSGTPTPLPWMPSLPVATEPAGEIAPPISLTVSVPSILRTQSPRAPPSRA